MARAVFPTFGAFRDAVRAELDQLSDTSTGSDPERIATAREPLRGASLLYQDRDLQPLLDSALRQGRALLVGADDTAYGWILDHHPPLAEWTHAPVRTSWAHWSIRLYGRRKGQPIIRVNRTLRAAPEQIPDELVEYLLWHELCHHLRPVHGHDAEFRRLEQLWPDAVTLDHQIDTLHERFDLEPMDTPADHPRTDDTRRAGS
jgi:hypothetical protein